MVHLKMLFKTSISTKTILPSYSFHALLPDILLDLPVAETVGGAALVAGRGPRALPLHLADEPLQVVRLAPHLRVKCRQSVVSLTR